MKCLALLLKTVLAVSTVQAQQRFVALEGHVATPAGKSNIATVLLTHAERKADVKPSLSLRYPLLPQYFQTDAQGDFKTDALDSEWLYSGYVIAPECRPVQFNRVDPTSGATNFSLEAVVAANFL